MILRVRIIYHVQEKDIINSLFCSDSYFLSKSVSDAALHDSHHQRKPDKNRARKNWTQSRWVQWAPSRWVKTWRDIRKTPIKNRKEILVSLGWNFTPKQARVIYGSYKTLVGANCRFTLSLWPFTNGLQCQVALPPRGSFLFSIPSTHRLAHLLASDEFLSPPWNACQTLTWAASDLINYGQFWTSL